MARESIEDQQELILQHEQSVARELANRVIDRPVLAWWMVLIPVFFVYYFYRFKKYTRALEDFTRNFLLTRHRALQEAVDAIRDKRKIDVARVIDQTGMLPEKSLQPFREWMEVLTRHYQDLLSSGGTTYARMIQKSYNTRANFLIHCNRLNKTERAYNRSLLPQISGDLSALRAIVDSIDTELETIRRTDAKRIFA